MTDNIEILAAAVRPGDAWLGDGTRLLVNDVRHEFGKFVPWGKPVNHPPEPMDAIVIIGELVWTDGRHRPHRGVWTLQPDMPILIERTS